MHHLRALLLAVLLGLVSPASRCGPADDVGDADRAFAARAAEVGQRAAFVEYLAAEAVLFRPEAVSGQQWLATHEPATGQLEWAPSATAVACTGRLALTTGRWRYSNAAGGEPVAGHYVSVWRRDDDGRWRVVLDHGIDHAPGDAPAEPLETSLGRLWATAEAGSCAGQGTLLDLSDAEQDLNSWVSRDGLPAALRRAAADGALAYRDAAAPGRLTESWPAGDARYGPGTVARSVDVMLDQDADLAVSHGVLEAAGGGPRSLYVRVWNRDRRHWRLAIDMQTPLPAAR